MKINTKPSLFAGAMMMGVAAVTSVAVVTVSAPLISSSPQPAPAQQGVVQADAGSEEVRPTEKDRNLVVTDTGTLRDFVVESAIAEYDATMADPDARSRLFGGLQRGFDEAAADAINATADSGVTIQNVLAFGFDRDHFWTTMSYSDIARGAVTAAVAACKRYAPGWVCDAAGRWLKSMASGYPAWSNHGVWGAVYWNRYEGGRW